MRMHRYAGVYAPTRVWRSRYEIVLPRVTRTIRTEDRIDGFPRKRGPAPVVHTLVADLGESSAAVEFESSLSLAPYQATTGACGQPEYW